MLTNNRKTTTKKKQQRHKEKSVIAPFQKEFLVGVLSQFPRNPTVHKILTGLPLQKKEVFGLSKQLIDSGLVPVKDYKALASLLALLSFEITDNK